MEGGAGGEGGAAQRVVWVEQEEEEEEGVLARSMAALACQCVSTRLTAEHSQAIPPPCPSVLIWSGTPSPSFTLRHPQPCTRSLSGPSGTTAAATHLSTHPSIHLSHCFLRPLPIPPIMVVFCGQLVTAPCACLPASLSCRMFCVSCYAAAAACLWEGHASALRLHRRQAPIYVNTSQLIMQRNYY